MSSRLSVACTNSALLHQARAQASSSTFFWLYYTGEVSGTKYQRHLWRQSVILHSTLTSTPLGTLWLLKVSLHVIHRSLSNMAQVQVRLTLAYLAENGCLVLLNETARNI